MDCEILETLYIRSNGDVLCNDDAGEDVLLGIVRTSLSQWSASSLFSNRAFRHIRSSLAHNKTPWPGVCERRSAERERIVGRHSVTQAADESCSDERATGSERATEQREPATLPCGS